ncbi:MAG: class I SAM-dependent methyltransferase [Alphaproteobacteria bacterium]
MSSTTIHMNDELDEYLGSVSYREPKVLAELREETRKDPRFAMQISGLQGQFMALLIKALGVKHILEVGVYTGYSSTAMALALPADGKIIALDISEEWTNLARKYWKKAGVDQKIELRLAPAVETMDALIKEGKTGWFDLIFLDADKWNYINYWERGLKLLRQGGIMIADNVLFQGVVPHRWTDEMLHKQFSNRPEAVRIELVKATHGAREFNAFAHKDERVDLSMLPVGDGITIARKR